LPKQKSLARKVAAMEGKLGRHDAELASIFRALDSVLNPPTAVRAKRPIGFLPTPRRNV
jgi:hypothetical protein